MKKIGRYMTRLTYDLLVRTEVSRKSTPKCMGIVYVPLYITHILDWGVEQVPEPHNNNDDGDNNNNIINNNKNNEFV
jgi:hypothetical protein